MSVLSEMAFIFTAWLFVRGKAVDEDEEAVTTDTSTEESDEDDQEEDGKETKEELGEWEEGKQELAGRGLSVRCGFWVVALPQSRDVLR